MYTQCTKPLSELYTICTNCIVEATNGFVMRHSMREFVHFSCCVITRVQIVYSRQNHASNVGFAVTDAHWITVSSSRSSQFLCICQMLSKSSGQIFSSHIGSKNVSCFCQIMSLCRWDTYKMCAKIWGSWTENFCVSVTQNRSVHGTDSRSISLKKKENYFNSDPWICLLNRIIKLLWS